MLKKTNTTVLILSAITFSTGLIFVLPGAHAQGGIPLSGYFIRYTGVPDMTYRLQRPPGVTGPWSNLATNTAPPSGLTEYHEINPPAGAAFYHTVHP